MQDGHDFFAQGTKIRGIAEHLAHLHRKKLQHLREHGRLVQDAVLQLRQAGAAEALHGLAHAPAQGRHGIIAEIVLIAQQYSLKQ
ncbi:hypothetical protein D3C72_1750300 [compost metagenome]